MQKFWPKEKSYTPTLTLQMQYWSTTIGQNEFRIYEKLQMFEYFMYKPLNTSIFRSRLVVNQCVWSSSGTFYPTSLVISVNVAGIKSPIITSFIILTHCLTILGAISFFVRKIISLVICILFIAWGRNIYKTNKK